jgi:hypothetical protein
MARSRFVVLTVVAVILTGVLIPTAWSDGDKTDKRSTPPYTSVSDKTEFTSKIYPLNDLGDDPNLCKWIADTITRVIQPGTWSKEGPTEGKDKCYITYYAPAKIMVVYHTPAVQARVEAFLKDVKKSVSQDPEKGTADNKSGRNAMTVVPAKYEEVVPAHPVDHVVQQRPGYPVPSRAQAPKHLFHFIIRYEGQGIVDDTVADVIKDVYKAKQAQEQSDTRSSNTEERLDKLEKQLKKSSKEDEEKKTKEDEEKKQNSSRSSSSS